MTRDKLSITRFTLYNYPNLSNGYTKPAPINWKRAENETAVVTVHAYADIPLPKRYDTIFVASQPQIVTSIPFTITQAIVNGWAPFDQISHGHKHILVLRFDEAIPEILKELPTFGFGQDPKNEQELGFCHSEDLPYIQQYLAIKLAASDQAG